MMNAPIFQMENLVTQQARDIDLFAAKQWLQNCLTRHGKRCNPESSVHWNPKRLIKIGKDMSIKLVSSSRLKTKAKYVALSHCWGGRIPHTLTTACEEEHRKEIPLDKVTQNIRDAIYTTRKLGLHYLWVDYLCIIQDLDSEKTAEFAVMNLVYSSATFTIAATNSEHGGQGLFQNRDWNLIVPQLTPTFFGSQLREIIALDPSLWRNEIVQAPLNKRAWTLQEMRLSCRILHFGKNRIFWTCSESWLSFTFPYSLPQHIFDFRQVTDTYYEYTTFVNQRDRIETTLALTKERKVNQEYHLMMDMTCRDQDIFRKPEEISSIQELYDETSGRPRRVVRSSEYRNALRTIWASFVECYSRRALTYPEDRTNAALGMLNSISRLFDTETVYGHPLKDFHVSLLWLPSGSFSPARHRAPSWSWFSFDGSVDTRNTMTQGLPTPAVKILNLPCPSTKGSSGTRQGALQLQGRLTHAFRDKSKQLSWQRQRQDFDDWTTKKKFGFTGMVIVCDQEECTRQPVQDDSERSVTELYLLPLVCRGKIYDRDTNDVSGLVLQLIENTSFERIGCFQCCSLSGFNLACDAFDTTEWSKAWNETYAEGTHKRVYDVFIY